jgi:hypothetical protein
MAFDSILKIVYTSHETDDVERKERQAHNNTANFYE